MKNFNILLACSMILLAGCNGGGTATSETAAAGPQLTSYPVSGSYIVNAISDNNQNRNAIGVINGESAVFDITYQQSSTTAHLIGQFQLFNNICFHRISLLKMKVLLKH